MDKALLLKRIRNVPLMSARLVEGLFAGNYRSAFRGPGLEFDEVREYTEGDDARAIDWNVSSRMSNPFCKTFREERELTLFLIIDASASLSSGNGNIGKREMVEVMAALFAFAAAHNGDKVGAAFFTNRIEKWVSPGKGRKHAARLVQDMENLRTRGQGSDLGLAIRTFQENQKTRGICIVLSDFRTTSGWHELTLLSRRHDVIAVRVRDKVDLDFPRTGLVELRDPESGRTMHVNGRSERFRQSYRDFWEMQDIYLKREFRKRKIPLINLDTADDPVEQLVAFLRRRKGRIR